MASFDNNALRAIANNVRDAEKRTVRLEGWRIRVPDNEGEVYPDGRTFYSRNIPITQLTMWETDNALV